MIEPTKRRLTLLFTALILAVIAVVFAIVSTLYHVNLRRFLEAQLQEEMIESVAPYAAAGNWSALADVVQTELYQVLDTEGRVVAQSHHSFGAVPPVNPALVRRALHGHAAIERVSMGGHALSVAYTRIGEDHVGRAVAPLSVLSDFDLMIVYLSLVGLPIVLALSYTLSRLLVARVMVPIRNAFTYQELFSANVSHELLSPLTALRGGMEVSLRRERAPEEYRRVLQEGIEQVDRVSDLLRDLEMLASARFRPADLLRERVDLSALVSQAVDARRASGVQLRWQPSIAQGISGSADRSLLGRVVENLLDNAVKYAAVGSEIRVALMQERGVARLTVVNPCAPLDATARTALFVPFSRGPDQRHRVPGRGLGLYLARYIARSHGGDLTLEPSKDTEFRVTVTLPLRVSRLAARKRP